MVDKLNLTYQLRELGNETAPLIELDTALELILYLIAKGCTIFTVEEDLNFGKSYMLEVIEHVQD